MTDGSRKLKPENQGLHIGVDASGMRCDYWGSSLSAPLSSQRGWSHWIITHDGASKLKSIWRDGQCVAGAAAATYSWQGKFINGRHFSGGGIFTGSLDDLVFWNRAFSPTEMANLYAGGKGLLSSLSKVHLRVGARQTDPKNCQSLPMVL